MKARDMLERRMRRGRDVVVFTGDRGLLVGLGMMDGKVFGVYETYAFE
jgi:hypothetical protein